MDPSTLIFTFLLVGTVIITLITVGSYLTCLVQKSALERLLDLASIMSDEERKRALETWLRDRLNLSLLTTDPDRDGCIGPCEGCHSEGPLSMFAVGRGGKTTSLERQLLRGRRFMLCSQCTRVMVDLVGASCTCRPYIVPPVPKPVKEQGAS